MGGIRSSAQPQPMGFFGRRPQGGVYNMSFPEYNMPPDAGGIARPSMFGGSPQPDTWSTRLAGGIVEPKSLGHLALRMIADYATRGGATSVANTNFQRTKQMQDIGMRSVEESGRMGRANITADTAADQIAAQKEIEAAKRAQELADLAFKRKYMGPWYDAQTKDLNKPELLSEDYSPTTKTDLEILMEQRKTASADQTKVIDSKIAEILSKTTIDRNILANEIMKRTGVSTDEALRQADEAIAKQEELEQKERAIEDIREGIRKRVRKTRRKKREDFYKKEGLDPIGSIIDFFKGK